MKWEMHENSLFAVLLRSPWWVSLLVAIGLAAALRIFLPLEFAIFGAAPFVVIAGVAGWRQLRRPGAKRIAATLERARALSAEAFREELEAGYRRRGYSAKRGEGAADLVITQRGIVTLVGCRRSHRWRRSRSRAGFRSRSTTMGSPCSCRGARRLMAARSISMAVTSTSGTSTRSA